MFCPNCGNPDQSAETYCRRCGTFLPDISKPLKGESPPEENLKVNTVLSLMTVIVSFTLAALLYAIMGFRPGTNPLIYVTAGLLIAMGAWHIQTFIRTRKLKKQWKERVRFTDGTQSSEKALEGKPSGSTSKLLDPPDFTDAVPASVTETTTKHLDAKLRSR